MLLSLKMSSNQQLNVLSPLLTSVKVTMSCFNVLLLNSPYIILLYFARAFISFKCLLHLNPQTSCLCFVVAKHLLRWALMGEILQTAVYLWRIQSWMKNWITYSFLLLLTLFIRAEDSNQQFSIRLKLNMTVFLFFIWKGNLRQIAFFWSQNTIFR